MAREITISEELEELQRELDDRKREYPELTRGTKPKLKREEANRRMTCLESTIKRLQRLQQTMQPAPQGLIFTDENLD